MAVLPFKNLNQDPKLDWLSVGIAETMVSDVKKSGGVQVVERDQIDKALAQIALQGEVKLAPATAVKVGKLVGARTIVLGAYQEAGNTVRITARFVSVETGVVKDAAKVTGPLTRIFHLQDAIVARLLGRREGHRYHAPKREKGSARTVKAYRLYAMSLQVASDAQRVTYLKQAVKVDPHFHYAADALAALQRRMQGYAAADLAARKQAAATLRARLGRPGLDPRVRAQEAFQLLTASLGSRRYHQLSHDAGIVLSLRWKPQPGGVDVQEYAGFCRFEAHYFLGDYDVALQYGEHFLKAYPGGTYYGAVEGLMNQMIAEKRKVEEGKVALRDEYAKLEKKRADAVAKARRQHQAPNRYLIRGLDLQRCDKAMSLDQWRTAVHECQAFIAAHGHDSDEGAVSLANVASYDVIQAYVHLGRFDDARRLAKKLIKRAPKWSRTTGIATQMAYWPR